jgi:aspartyl-tRNA(Asn)/glutamyl-tRNA(Gln) amidotransferase subunit A
VGALTTTVADTALLLDVMSGPDTRDRTCLPAHPVRYVDALDRTALEGVRVAWSRDLGFAVVDPDVADVCERAAHDVAAAIGTGLRELPVSFTDFTGIYATIEGVDRFIGVDADLYENRLEELDPLSAPGWRYFQSRTLPDGARVEARRRQLVATVATVFDHVDLVITPMASVPAFGAEGPMPEEINGVIVHGGMSVVLSFLASLANLPAISVPAGRTASGLPIGLQIIGPRFREDLVLAVAARYESAHPWPRHSTMATS